MQIDPKLLDEIAEKEVKALLDGLNDPELSKNPQFLDKVRKFLQQNKLITHPETPGVKKIQQDSTGRYPKKGKQTQQAGN